MIVLTSEDSCCNSRKANYPFSSLQFNLPKLASRKIIQWGEANIPDEDIYSNLEEPQYGREYESHVTVLYGIHEETPKEIKRLLHKQKPFYIEFGKISIFDCPKFDVVKIEVESIELRRINRLLQEHLTVTNNANAFRPHVTIAFLKKGKGAKLIGKDDFAGNRILADRLVFSSKTSTQTTIELSE
jgi:hypothetical protein